MKKFILILIMVGIPFSGICQGNNSFTRTEVVAGAGISGGQAELIWESSVAFVLGVETNLFTISNKSSIISGIVFSKQGGPNYKKEVVDGTGYSGYNGSGYGKSYRIWSDGTASLFYIAIPLLYEFKTKGGFYLEGGLQGGLLISAKTKTSSNDGENIKENFNSFELSVPVGIGYWFNDHLGIGIRTVNGLTNINSDKIMNEVYYTTDRSSILLAVLRYNF